MNDDRKFFWQTFAVAVLAAAWACLVVRAMQSGRFQNGFPDIRIEVIDRR